MGEEMKLQISQMKVEFQISWNAQKTKIQEEWHREFQTQNQELRVELVNIHEQVRNNMKVQMEVQAEAVEPIVQ